MTKPKKEDLTAGMWLLGVVLLWGFVFAALYVLLKLTN